MPPSGGRVRAVRYRLRNPVRFFILMILIFVVVPAILIFARFLKAPFIPSLPEPAPASESAVPVRTPVPAMPKESPASTPGAVEVEWRDFIVALDAGHGGRDPGAVAPGDDDIYEKEITLAVTRACRDLLAQEGITVLMTREEDKALAETVQADLTARCGLANDGGAALFASVHVNSLELTVHGALGVSGMECYYAEKENLFPPFHDEKWASLIGEACVKANGNKLNGIIEKRLAVLRGTFMPAVLLEIGYITNKDDLARMTSSQYLQDTAEGIAAAVLKAVAEMPAEKRNGVWQIRRTDQIVTEDNHGG